MHPEIQSPTSRAAVAWGRKPSAKRAQLWASLKGQTVVHMEDGFLRSYAPGPAFPALSWVVDEEGVHYDCTRPSQLETLLNSGQDVCVPQQDHVLQFMLQHRLSKYNHAPAHLLEETFSGEAVLVVDQTYGDLSVTYGAANTRTFQHMLQAALAENPDATIYIKTHPQTASGHKRGYLTHVPPHPRVVLLTQATNPMQLLAHMRRVYVVSSTMGFEALLMGKPVVCFGVPHHPPARGRDGCHALVGVAATNRCSMAWPTAGSTLGVCRHAALEEGAHAPIFWLAS